MISSIRDVCIGAVCAYTNIPRPQWVLEWPGMVILCASSVHWTTEVTEAITANTLPVSLWNLSYLIKVVLTDSISAWS